MFIRIILIILITLISHACTEYSSEWQAILEQDIKHSWRNESTNKYIKTNGDFNGDGLIDSAELQINKSKSLVRFIVYINSSNNEVTPYILDDPHSRSKCNSSYLGWGFVAQTFSGSVINT